MALGAIISVLGIVGVTFDNLIVRHVALALAIASLLFFGWRMILALGRVARKEDKRRRRARTK
jgi:hypothetical protein